MDRREEAEALRSVLERMGRGPGKRYSAELRARIRSYAESERSDGAGWKRIAHGLGIRSYGTVRGMCVTSEPVKRPRKLVRVEVAPAASRARYRVESRSGAFVGELSLEEAATLLRLLS